MSQQAEKEQTNKKCPMRSFKDCLLGGCAWYYANECSMRSMGFIDHTLRVMVEAVAPGKAEVLFANYAGGREETGNGTTDALPGADE